MNLKELEKLEEQAKNGTITPSDFMRLRELDQVCKKQKKKLISMQDAVVMNKIESLEIANIKSGLM
jgi:hypothetical protein